MWRQFMPLLLLLSSRLAVTSAVPDQSGLPRGQTCSKSVLLQMGRKTYVDTTNADGHSGHKSQPLNAWIYSFGRSGSSTLYELLMHAAEKQSEVFGLYEPCHMGDRTSFSTCTEEMDALTRCNFTGIQHLYFQRKNKIANGFEIGPEFSEESARCNEANFRVFKTIHMHDLQKDVVPMLRRDNRMRVLYLVRDPRGIYQSAKKKHMVKKAIFTGKGIVKKAIFTPAWQSPEMVKFMDSLGERSAYGRQYIEFVCRHLVSRIRVHDKRMMTVKFEDIIRDNGETAREALRFLGHTIDDRLNVLISKYYPHGKVELRKINHLDDAWESWEIDAFNTPSCREALGSYGYDEMPLGSVQKPVERDALEAPRIS